MYRFITLVKGILKFINYLYKLSIILGDALLVLKATKTVFCTKSDNKKYFTMSS